MPLASVKPLMQIWAQPQCLRHEQGDKAAITTLSPVDSNMFVCGMGDGVILLWDLRERSKRVSQPQIPDYSKAKSLSMQVQSLRVRLAELTYGV